MLSLEHKFQKEIVKALFEMEKRGKLIFHANLIYETNFKTKLINNQLGLRKGLADITILLSEGKSVYLELKAKTGRQSDDQKIMENKIKQFGHNYIILVDDGSYKDLEIAIKNLTTLFLKFKG